jgi:hypothetical protein
VVFVPIHKCPLDLLVSLSLFAKYASRRKYIPARMESNAIIVPTD